jgi:hypothetical protein
MYQVAKFSRLMAKRPLVSNTKLLLHGDGADASTSITDSSYSGHTITVNGNTQIDTAQSVFGGSSILFDGTGDYLSLDGSADFAFGTGDFTVDFRLRFNALSGSNQHLIEFRSGGFALYVRGGFNDLSLYYGGDQITGGAFSAGTWYHIACARASGSTKLFIDGTQIGSTYSDSNNYTITSSKPFIGCDDVGTSGFVNGWMDEMRVVKGSAAWTSNFTPPSSAYTP